MDVGSAVLMSRSKLKILTTSLGMEDGLGPETLDTLALRGAQAMLHQALEEEVVAYLARHQEHREEVGEGRKEGRSRRCRSLIISCLSPTGPYP